MIEPIINATLYTQPVMNFTQVCELNQYAMLQQVQALNPKSFWLSLIILSLLVFWLVIQPLFPKLEEKLGIELVRASAGLSIFLTLLLMYTALGLTEHQLKTIETWLYVLLVAILVPSLWILWKKHKDKMNVT